MYAKVVKTNQIKAESSEIKPYSLCLGSISKDVTVDNMKKIGLNGKVYTFSVNCQTIDVSDIKDIDKYFMKKKILYHYLDSVGKCLLF